MLAGSDQHPGSACRFLRCCRCGREDDLRSRRWRCACGGPWELDGPVTPFPRDLVGRPSSLWRYHEALPFARGDAEDVSLGEGMSPAVPFTIDGRDVVVKLEHGQPTRSFKDRGAVMLALRARRLHARRLVADSSGNAGLAIATYASRVGIPCRVFVPASTPPARTAAVMAAGAEVMVVDGSREDVADAAVASLDDATVYASHVWDPFFTEGTKTFAYEVWEQMGGVPDRVVLPAGNGTLVLGAWLGFEELRRWGYAGSVPAIVAVQAELCAPIAAAFREGEERVAPTIDAGTAARGIAIGSPPRGDAVLRAVRASGGRVLSVSEDQIEDARSLSDAWDLRIDPSAAAALAGLRAALPAEGTTVGCVTGAAPDG